MDDGQVAGRHLPRNLSSDWRKLFKAARQAGWEVTRTTRHYRLVKAHRKMTFHPSTDPRALRNARAQLRRAEEALGAKDRS